MSTAAAVLAVAGAGQAMAASVAGAPAASAVTVTAAVRSDLTALYASSRGIPRRDVAALTAATVWEAHQPSARTWWAVARFRPAARDPLAVSAGFQDGAGTVVFTRHASGRWRIERVAGTRSLDCRGALPASIQHALRLTDTAACAPPATRTRHRTVRRAHVRPSIADPNRIAAIAASNIGVADTPASTRFSFDCDPYTTLVGNTWVSSSGCGVDPRYKVQNRNELWCADFAKSVWEQGGVGADLGTLTAAASSFYTWGAQQKESLPVDPSYPPAPGDAVVFYGPGLTPGQTAASHVGIVVSVNSNGTVNMANGDFLGSSNISVQGNNNISFGPWSAGIWGSGTRWVYVSPGASVVTAFQANSGSLWLDSGGAGAGQSLGMMVGTSPAVASGPGGPVVAFQANTGMLWTDSGGVGTNRQLGMMPGTSPAIAALSTGGYEIAFQANTGYLWLVGPNGAATDQRLGMMAGTSPAIAASPGGGFEVAYQANTGDLWTDTGGAGANQHLGMARGTSPAIAALPGGGYVIADQANTGELWTDTNGVGASQHLGMQSGTSPAITAAGGGTQIAFVANTGELWTDTNGVGASQHLGTDPGSSPSITADGGGTEIAFQANTGMLWIDINGAAADQHLGMSPDTSPAIG